MKGLEMVKCKSLRINMFRITHTGKSVNFPVTSVIILLDAHAVKTRYEDRDLKDVHGGGV